MAHELEQSQIIAAAEKPKHTFAQNTLKKIEQTYAGAKPDSLRVRVLKDYVEYLDAYSYYQALPDSATIEELDQASEKVRAVETGIEQHKTDKAYEFRYDKTDKMAEKLARAYEREGAASITEAFIKTVVQFRRIRNQF